MKNLDAAHVPQRNASVNSGWSYLGVKLRQLFFIKVSLGVDAPFITELKHKNRQSDNFLDRLVSSFLRTYPSAEVNALCQVWKTRPYLLLKNQKHKTTFDRETPNICSVRA